MRGSLLMFVLLVDVPMCTLLLCSFWSVCQITLKMWGCAASPHLHHQDGHQFPKGTRCLLQQSMRVPCMAPVAAGRTLPADIVAACRMQWRSRQYTPKPRGGGGARGRGGPAARGGRGGGRGGFGGARPSAASGSEDDEERPRWRRDDDDEDDEPTRRDASRGETPGCTDDLNDILPISSRTHYASLMAVRRRSVILVLGCGRVSWMCGIGVTLP
jgi:hypothetical protein